MVPKSDDPEGSDHEVSAEGARRSAVNSSGQAEDSGRSEQTATVRDVARKWGFADVGSDWEFVCFLVSVLHHPELKVHARAAMDLGELRAVRGLVLPQLAAAMDRDPAVRFWAATALGWLLPDDGRTVPELVEAMRDPNPYVRLTIAIWLGKLGPAARGARAALTAALHDRNKAVQTAAGWALTALEPKAGAAIQ